MLTKAMRKYVISEDKSGYTNAHQTTYKYRLENYTKQALEDLAFLAEKLPEEQLEKVFNAKTLTPFFNSLFRLKIEAADHKDWLQKKKELKPRRDRLLKLSGAVLRIVGDGRFAVVLLPESLRFELDKMNPSVENLRTVFYTSMQEQEREEE